MKKYIIVLLIPLMFLLSGCSEISENALLPMSGLEWFAGYDEVKARFSSYPLVAERQKEENQQIQKMLDYADVPLFDTACDLTLCFYQDCLIGFNYHDTAHVYSYREWLDKIETVYGMPTEEGTGMAVWY